MAYYRRMSLARSKGKNMNIRDLFNARPDDPTGYPHGQSREEFFRGGEYPHGQSREEYLGFREYPGLQTRFEFFRGQEYPGLQSRAEFFMEL